MDLHRDGAERSTRRLTACEFAHLSALCETLGARPRARLPASTDGLAGRSSTLLDLAQERLGPTARPVRAVLFDKTPGSNWGVAWHQDRTITVAERRETPGFGPWSRKGKIAHVEPPFDVLAGMLTVRAHLDHCDEANAPLLIAMGSHTIGKVAADQACAVAARFEQVSCLAEAGEVWLYRTPILHASKPAAAPRRRRVLQMDFAAADLPGGLVWAAS